VEVAVVLVTDDVTVTDDDVTDDRFFDERFCLF
jgi:hypothetical protein